MNVNSATLQTAITLAGITFLLMASAGNFSTFHRGNLHMDAADHVLAISNTEKIMKYVPALSRIFIVKWTIVTTLLTMVFVLEPFPRTFIRNYRFRPRSPPAGLNAVSCFN